MTTSATSSCRSSTSASRRSPERDARAVQGKSSGGYGALVLPMLRPDLWGGLGDVSGDAAFEYCYLPDFPAAWAVLREHDSIEEFWEQMLDDPTPSPPTFAAVNAIAMAACYSPGPDGEPELPWSDGGRLAARGCLGALAGLGPGADDRRPPRRSEDDARDLARVRPAGRVEPLRRHGDAPHAASTTRVSSIALSSSRASTAASRIATRPLVAWLAERLAPDA